MPARSTWRGALTIAGLSIPVRAFNSIDRSPDIELHQYHASCGSPIKQSRYCPKHGSVESSEISMGFEYASEQVILFSNEELDSISPTDSKEIDIQCFVAPSAISGVYLSGKHLYVVPDGSAAQRPFAAIQKALELTNKIGISKMVLYQREQLITIWPLGKMLCISVLEYSDKVRCAADYESEIDHVDLIDEELQLCKQLVDVLTSSDFSLVEYTDPRTTRLQALIEARIQRLLNQPSEYGKLNSAIGGGSPEAVEPQPQSALAATLRATLRALPPQPRSPVPNELNPQEVSKTRQTG